MEKAEAASSPEGAMGAWAIPALATVMPQKNCSTIIFLSFHQRSHWELQPSTWPFQIVNIRFASVVHMRWVELLGTAILIPTETQQRGEMDVFAAGGKAHWTQKGSSASSQPWDEHPYAPRLVKNQQAQPHLSFLFLTKSQVLKASQDSQLPTPGICWPSRQITQLSWWTVLERWSAT